MSERIDHFPEPWRVRAVSPDNLVLEVDDPEAPGRSGDTILYLPNMGIDRANADRIVLCVNYCAGLSTEELVEKLRQREEVAKSRRPAGLAE